MNITMHQTLRIALLAALLSTQGATRHAKAQEAVARPPAPSLKRPSASTHRVDDRGFIRQWLLLEPVPVSGRLTAPAVQEALGPTPFKGAHDVPREGDAVQLGDAGTLEWHAVETIRYNVNLYHFARALSKPTSNVLFWAVSVIDSPREMPGVRLAICSNAASNWWLNGQRVIELYDDRQSVIDDGVSKRLTLKKGRNVIHGAVVNGGGATDFCARFLDARDEPVTGLAVLLQPLAARGGTGEGEIATDQSRLLPP